MAVGTSIERGSDCSMSIWLPGGRLIQSVAAANDTSITFSNLNSAVDLWYRLIFRIANDTGGGINYKLYVNADTTDSNYHAQYIQGNDSTANAGRSNVPYIGSVVVSQGAIILVDIFCTPNGFFTYRSRAIYHLSSSVVNVVYVGVKSSGASGAITSLTITADAANGIRSGSVLDLYRR